MRAKLDWDAKLKDTRAPAAPLLLNLFPSNITDSVAYSIITRASEKTPDLLKIDPLAELDNYGTKFEE